MNKLKSYTKNIKYLLMLQKSRMIAQEKLLLNAKQDYEDAFTKTKQRERNIELIKGRKNKLHEYLQEKYDSNVHMKLERGYANRFWYNYDLEVHEYYLEQENQYLKNVKDKYDDLLIRLIKLQKKSEYFNNMLNNYTKQLIDLKEETDMEESNEHGINIRRNIYGEN